jgi:diacylglycerol kinase (ATP)
MKGQPFYRRLVFAINGLKLAFFQEHSFRNHVISSAGVLIALIITRPAPIWWAIGVLAVAVVMVAELINTAIETLADHIHPESHQEIRAVKDIAASAVLISSITAVLVAVVFLFYFFYAY